MKILYLISKYITLPATVVKGLWEHITCGALKVLVEDGRYLQANELCGHVEHELTTSKVKAFLVSFIPTVINGLLAFFLGGAGFMGLFVLRVTPPEAAEGSASQPIAFWLYIVLFYLGVSFFCNMFPLFEDAINNWGLLYQTKLTAEQKEANEKIKAEKAYQKEAKKLAKANGQKTPEKKKNGEEKKLVKETSIFTKILLFIPSAIMLTGSFLEKHGLTFIISIIVTVLAIVL
ncbi:MAG: hypothetical protein IJZ57_09565 [Clostridia bacterium]|nr:hypothetical protein [Clostridia bacterium]